MRALLALLSGLLAAGAAATALAQRVYDVEIVNAFPHDSGAYTQGLLAHQGALYESTGHYGASSLRLVDLETGDIVQRKPLPDEVFGEGIAVWDDHIIALTWREKRGFVFDLHTFEITREFSYAGEGWGLTDNGEHLIMSDGTPILRFLDPESLKETGRLAVTYRGKPLAGLNELEWIEGEIWANVWKSDGVVRIDPDSGVVTGVIDMRPLRTALGPMPGRAEVLNGIAYDRETERIFVTGKYWPKLFEIDVIERNAAD